jgi:Uma2 family endonuclease
MGPPGAVHAMIATRVATLLQQHVDAHQVGVVMTPAGFHLASKPDTVREPDVAFVRRDRIPTTGIPEGFWPGPPDLAVEIRSPGDRRSEITAKVREYLNRGVRLVWVVDPKQKSVTAYRRLTVPLTVRIEGTLDAADVVPGFRCEVRRIFE